MTDDALIWKTVEVKVADRLNDPIQSAGLAGVEFCWGSKSSVGMVGV